jgi:hydroxymethylglutaryl-CoA synthase
MMNLGIDKLGVYIPKTYIDLVDLAQARGIDPNKYTIGIGQKKMAIPSPSEDVITMALEAAHSILDESDKAAIDLILFATESAVDYSKAAGIYVHAYLNISPQVRILELKQACYASTGALRLALNHVHAHPTSKVLILSSDVAWYGFNTGGEATQGAGAIALLVSQDPRIAIVHEGNVRVENQQDFYRPSYSKVPVVDGKLSIKCYQDILKQVEDQKAYAYTCFHMPFAAMANKANAVLTHPMNDEQLSYVKGLGQEVGNIYNGSLYLSLLSILYLVQHDLSFKTLGMFAYGSGAIGEFFTLTIQANYKKGLNLKQIQSVFNDRIKLSIDDYAHYMSEFVQKESSSEYETDLSQCPSMQMFALKDIKNGHRSYQKLID